MKLAFRVAGISAVVIPVLVALLVIGISVAWPAATVRAAAVSCDSLKTLSLPNTVIDSASGTAARFTVFMGRGSA